MKTINPYATLAILFLLILALAGVGCGQSNNAEASTDDSHEDGSRDTIEADGQNDSDDEDDEDKEEPVPVEVAALELGEIEAILHFSSNLEAEEQVQVFSQAKRLVRELLVEEGDRVRKNQVLVRLQDDEQRSQLAKVESQLSKARRDYDRQKRLYEQELISDQVYSESLFDFEQQQISVEDARRELGYTEVRAPIAGTVTERRVKVGDQVQIGQHLFDIVDFESLVARVFVPEKYLQQLRPGLDARLSTSASMHQFVGQVERVSPIVDPDSGTVKVTISIGAQPGLRPGLYVDVNLVTATHTEAILIPKRAVVYDADQMFVYRLGDERRVERVFVEAALSDKEFLEPRDGFDAGDQVVIAGQTGLKNETLVSLPGDKDEDDADADESAVEVTETAQVTR